MSNIFEAIDQVREALDQVEDALAEEAVEAVEDQSRTLFIKVYGNGELRIFGSQDEADRNKTSPRAVARLRIHGVEDAYDWQDIQA